MELQDVGAVNVLVSMAGDGALLIDESARMHRCGVQCPYIPGAERCDWGLEDPTGQGDEKFIEVIRKIEEKIRALGGTSA